MNEIEMERGQAAGDEGRPNCRNRNPSKCHFVCHKSALDWNGIDRYFRGEEPATRRSAEGTRMTSLKELSRTLAAGSTKSYVRSAHQNSLYADRDLKPERPKYEAQVLLSLLPGWVLNVVYVRA